MKVFFKGFLIFLGVCVLSVVVGLPIYANHKGYSNVFDYVKTLPVFEDEKDKTVEDEIVDDTLTEDETTEDDSTEEETSGDETNTETEEQTPGTETTEPEATEE